MLDRILRRIAGTVQCNARKLIIHVVRGRNIRRVLIGIFAPDVCNNYLEPVVHGSNDELPDGCRCPYNGVAIFGKRIIFFCGVLDQEGNICEAKKCS